MSDSDSQHVLPSPPSSPQLRLEKLQSVDGLAVVRSSMGPRGDSRMRVLSCCDTSVSLNLPDELALMNLPLIREEPLAQKGGDDEEGNGSDSGPMDSGSHDALPIRVSLLGSIREEPLTSSLRESDHSLDTVDTLPIIVDVVDSN